MKKTYLVQDKAGLEYVLKMHGLTPSPLPRGAVIDVAGVRILAGHNFQHNLDIPRDAGHGLTDYVAICKCGARWRCYYSRQGLEWTSLNDQCDNHNADPSVHAFQEFDPNDPDSRVIDPVFD